MMIRYLLLPFCLLIPFASVTQSTAASPESQATAAAKYERFRRVVIDVNADSKFAGKEIVAKEGKNILGKTRLSKTDGRTTATLILPMPPVGKSYGAINIKAGRKILASVTLPDADIARREALYLKRLKFWPSYVIDGEQLPICDFEDPAGAEDLIGAYKITIRYIDTDGNEVTCAAKPGRYGAITEIKCETGWIHRRFTTLYRSPQKINWQFGGGPKTSCTLPAALGIDPAVAESQADQINAFAREKTIQGLLTADENGAIFLASLNERERAENRDATQMNDDWWFSQRKRLGLIERRYEIDLPKGHSDNPDRRYPLILFLHGAEECGIESAKVRKHGPWKFISEHPEYECIVVGPQCDPYMSQFGTWVGQTREINDLIDELLAKYPVDPDRIYITGFSLGGFGAYSVASAYPERFAAAAPICAGGKPVELARMKSVPTWAFHGAKDLIVPLAWGQKAVDSLKAAGGDARLTVYPDAGHDSWTETYSNPEFYEWLFKQKRAVSE